MSVTLNPSSSYASEAASCKCPKTTFERNSDAYGPVAATALGLAQATANGASATVSISDQALGKLAEVAQDVGVAACHGVGHLESGLQSVGHAIGEGLHEVEHAAETVYGSVAQAASNVGDAIGSAGSKLAAYAAISAQAVKDWV